MKKLIQFGFSLLCGIIIFQSASAQTNIYMKLVSATLGTIAGESTSKIHPNFVDVSSVGQNITGCATFNGSTGTPCAANLGDFTIQKNLDKTSPVLAQIMNTGGNLSTVDLYYTNVVSATETQYYTVHLTNVYITKISEVATESNTNAKIQQQVSFAATTATWTYNPQSASGSLLTPVSYTWTRP